MIAFNKNRVRFFEEKILPLHKKSVEYAKEWVNSMQLNTLYLLEAQKEFLEKRREYLNTRIELDQAFLDLELHLGGKLPY